MEDADSAPVIKTYLEAFDTTLAPTLLESEALGVLYFAVCLHQRTYISDIALGDHQLLIGSHATKGRLYRAVVELIEAGELIPHVRKTATIEGTVVCESPTIPQLRSVWEERDAKQGRNHFTHQIPRERVLDYANNIQSAVNRHVEWYDPNAAKQRFRSTVIKAATGDTVLRAELSKLPAESRKRYEGILERPYFTRADVWDETRDNAELTQIHAFLNEQSHAHLVGAGLQAVTTAETPISEIDRQLQTEVMFAHDRSCLTEASESSDRPLARVRLAVPEDLARQFEEALDSGNAVRLGAPALSLLSLLSPAQVIQLKAEARRTIFKFTREANKWPSVESFMAVYVPQLQEYLGCICEKIASWYPDEFREHRVEQAALLWGPLATLRAIASGNFWTSVRSHLGALIEKAVGGALKGGILTVGGRYLAEQVGATSQVSVPLAVGVGAASAGWDVGKELLAIAKATREADMVILWGHPGVRQLGSATPRHWMNLAHAGNRWLA